MLFQYERNLLTLLRACRKRAIFCAAAKRRGIRAAIILLSFAVCFHLQHGLHWSSFSSPHGWIPHVSQTPEPDWNVSEEVALFGQHIGRIEAAVRAEYRRTLGPWKTNQNVSVDVVDNGFGEALLRVTALQNPTSATPGVMQVGVKLHPNRQYRVLYQGCRLKPLKSSAKERRSSFRACPFVDVVGRADGVRFDQKVLVWECGKGLKLHAHAPPHGDELPCQDLDFVQGKTSQHLFERSLGFNSTAASAGYRFGIMFSGFC